ncbi:hypothetical protein HBI56_161970 [Parastagonospora nodorum]|uniref:Uncharacterized protein n=1 Tax=Phaeosphaeria nodorum (strain SN15 / ATCC MYA-4574 / FGSC 10173) TaxID=321614 RepID=A0A7U2NPR6_PHANO|nr:hypothetical protein HBH56_210670 [Parastagonospora nodorum]QRD05956.1 hypothetical protein JI435_422980 [Parastagonospora nodorum SN15]KAH3931645.1 hypothetical protein HBH54_099280 [Parastagonospora nodorum]KAH3960737.1 hypothetical protein HBH51_189030 [Parastagonospora nodorum]KAH3962773.1 hypothetical protein HBH52_221700 [Parastagonospora nodorum]
MLSLFSPLENRQSSFNLGLDGSQLSARSSSRSPANFFKISQALFAGLSVIIGLLALVIGLLQLRKHRKRRLPQDNNLVFELEAYYPEVE